MQDWTKLLDGEPVSDLAHHLRDERMIEMKRSDIQRLQDEASQAYERLSTQDAGPYLQAVMLAEVAQQLAKQNELLEMIAQQLRNGIPVERV